ncbi:hypothetical protein MC7420_2277 [Coleofasciculus chthonoplastes PCC 7420]|uniref:Uncharacterized protein n=1 Tax=Coleofasciculus chthonoplastes PCC 7420 TaxID=118168 RepID=B4VS66_9CYAN|nr:hypothetical protein MC7420_2277 [Coleofasciculus chthonoplastes PCC 7420]
MLTSLKSLLLPVAYPTARLIQQPLISNADLGSKSAQVRAGLVRLVV